jgi:Flp pilus assembly protein TadG
MSSRISPGAQESGRIGRSCPTVAPAAADYFNRVLLLDSRNGNAPRPGRSGRVSDAGQGLVEFTLILPVFLIILFGIIEFGWAMRAYVIEQNAAREGARYWAITGKPGGGCSDITTQITNKAPTLGGLTTTYDIDGTTTTTCLAVSPSAIGVQADYTYNFITPLGTFITSIAGPLTISSKATMRVE